jgi:hypothetical protein
VPTYFGDSRSGGRINLKRVEWTTRFLFWTRSVRLLPELCRFTDRLSRRKNQAPQNVWFETEPRDLSRLVCVKAVRLQRVACWHVRVTHSDTLSHKGLHGSADHGEKMLGAVPSGIPGKAQARAPKFSLKTPTGSPLSPTRCRGTIAWCYQQA